MSVEVCVEPGDLKCAYDSPKCYIKHLDIEIFAPANIIWISSLTAHSIRIWVI